MLHALELENFKAFGERVRIPFAPITLVFRRKQCRKEHNLASTQPSQTDARKPRSGGFNAPSS